MTRYIIIEYGERRICERNWRRYQQALDDWEEEEYSQTPKEYFQDYLKREKSAMEKANVQNKGKRGEVRKVSWLFAKVIKEQELF